MKTSRVRSIHGKPVWRSGTRWETEWVEISRDAVTEAMRADPRLEVVDVPETAGVEVVESRRKVGKR